jgi:pyruvate-ferredoxin/flavodoxin oxidoreductase
MAHGLEQQKLAVQSGHWPLFRFNPALAEQGKNPMVLDSRAPSIPLDQYIYNETRYTMLKQSQPEVAAELLEQAQEGVAQRWKLYEYLAQKPANGEVKVAETPKPAPAAAAKASGNGHGD